MGAQDKSVELTDHITIQDYARLTGKSVASVYQAIYSGAIKSAQKIDHRWYIDPKEPWPHAPIAPADGLVTPTQYARLIGASVVTVYQALNKGKLLTAKKVGRHYLIDASEPWYTDAPPNMILLTEWANAMGMTPEAARALVKKGLIANTVKKNGNWYVDPKTIRHTVIAAPQGYVTVPEYADAYNSVPGTVYSAIRRGRVQSAVQVNGHWYIDPSEPWPVPPPGKVTASVYAELHGISGEYVRQAIRKGQLTSGERFGRLWYVSPTEPFFAASMRKPKRFARQLVCLEDYADAAGLDIDLAKEACVRGDFASALCCAGHWYLDPDDAGNGSRRPVK